MASLPQVDDRSQANRTAIIELKAVVQSIMDNTIPLGWLEINSTGDLTGKYLYGVGVGDRASINDGRGIYGWLSTVANPTQDSHFSSPKGFSN